MKIFKLVFGIICCVLFVLVSFQSCAAGVANSLADNGEISGSAGLFLAILMLTGGIVMIVTRNSQQPGGSIACAIIYILAALLGFTNAGSYSDLNVWAGLCLILGIVNAIFAVKLKKKQ
mgnify:FL=1